MSTLLFANQLQTTLATAIDSTSTTITVAAGTGAYFPAIGSNQSMNLTIVNPTNALINEIVSCTSITGDVLTVIRAQEGTVARSWPAGSFIDNLMTAGTSGAFVQQYGLENQLYSASFINMATETGSVTAIPIHPTDLVNKQYVDTISNSQYKAECQVATTANITLSGLQTIDGYTTISGDRVVVKNQTLSASNGIYIASSSSWTRSTDMSTWAQVPGAYTFIQNGTLYANTSWVCIEPEIGTIDVSPINWIQVSGNGSYTAGTGLTLTGTQFSITNTGITSGSYGTASEVAYYTVNAQGQLTLSSNVPISISSSQINTPIQNSGLQNSSITINGNSISLGGSTTVTAVTPNSVTFNNSGSGGTSPSTFDGASALTVSYNTVGASPLAGSSSLTTVGTVTSGTWQATPIANNFLANSTISGISLGSNLLNLSAGTGLSGGTYNGGSSVTFNIANTTVTAGSYGADNETLIATTNAQGQLTALSATAIAISNSQVSGLGTMSTQNSNAVSITGGNVDGTIIGGTTRASGNFTNLSASGSLILSNYTGYIFANASGNVTASSTIPTTSLSGTISNAQLANSAITINGNLVSLGGSTTVTAVTPNSLTFGTGLNSGSFNGSSAVTVSLANIGTSGTYGSSNSIAVLTTNAQGQVSSVSNTNIDAISLTTGQISTAPVASNDIVNKLYVDTVAQGLSAKDSVYVATTANITLSGEQTIDGQLTSSSRVLVKNQTSSQNNGIYISSASSWARSADASTWNELVGAFVFVESGTTQESTGWVCQAQPGGTIGTSPVPWSQFSGAGTYTAGTGLTLTGNQFSITSTGVSAGPYGSSNSVPTITFNSQGQATSASNTAISIAASQINTAIPNSGLANSTISGVSLGSNLFSLTLGTGLTGSSYNGSSSVTAAIDTTVVATLTGAQTLTNKTISGSSNTLTNIANSSLVNSSLTVNGVSISLGSSGTVTAAAGTLTGTTLASNVINSSLTSFGSSPTLSNPTLLGTITASGLTASQVVVTNTGSQLATISYGTSSSANSLVERDSNQNAFANNFISNASNVTSAGGTTTLTASSARLQQLTGSSTQTFQLPDATTLTIGSSFSFSNNSSGLLTVTNNGGTTICTVSSGSLVELYVISISTANGSWDFNYLLPSNVTWGTSGLISPTFVTPVLGTPSSGTLTNCTGYSAGSLTGSTLNSGVTASSLTSFGSSPTLSSPTLSGTVTASGLTASQAVVTNSSKQLASVSYVVASTANTIALRDSNGNSSFSAIIGSNGNNVSSFSDVASSTDYYSINSGTNNNANIQLISSSANASSSILAKGTGGWVIGSTGATTNPLVLQAGTFGQAHMISITAARTVTWPNANVTIPGGTLVPTSSDINSSGQVISIQDVVGTTAAGNATTGNVGEYQNSTQSTAVNAGTTNTYSNITSLSLTAGDWDVSGLAIFSTNGAVLTSGTAQVVLSLTTGNSNPDLAVGYNYSTINVSGLTSNQGTTIPIFRVNQSSTVTVYLKGNISYSSGTPQWFGSITARRVR